jgi:hypothetical protein
MQVRPTQARSERERNGAHDGVIHQIREHDFMMAMLANSALFSSD